MKKKLEQAHLALAFESPGFTDPLLYTAQIFSTALGGGMSSRLFQELRERRGLCYSIYASTGAHAETGLMTIYAATSGEDLPALSRLTLDELKRAAGDMTEAEVARARAQMKAGLLDGAGKPVEPGRAAGAAGGDLGPGDALDETVERIDAVTAAGVRDFAERLIGTAPALALYGPVGKAPSAGPAAGEARRLMFIGRRRVRIETERMILRPPAHADFRAWTALARRLDRVPQPLGADLGHRPPDPQGLCQPRLLGAALDRARARRCRCS